MSYADEKALRESLREQFKPEQIGHMPKGGIQIPFVGHAIVTDRLNRVAPGWFYTIDEMFTVDKTCWVKGTMTIGDVSRPEYGDGKNPKEAVGNFIRRGAMRFGVAIDLWSKEELEESAELEPGSTITSGTTVAGMGEAEQGAEGTGEGPEAPASSEGSDVPSAAGDVTAPSPAPSEEQQRKDFRAYLAERYGTAQALLMARELFQTKARPVKNMTQLDLSELQAIDTEFKDRETVPA